MERAANGQIVRGIAGNGVWIGPDAGPTCLRAGGGANGNPSVAGDRIFYVNGDRLHAMTLDGSADAEVYSGLVTLASGAQAASGYIWAAFRAWSTNPQPRVDGVWTSWGLILPTAVLLGMAKADGAVIVGDNYQTGIGLSVYFPGEMTARHAYPDARPRLLDPYSEAAILDVDRFVWTEQSGQVLRGSIAVAQPLGTALHPSLADRAGTVWVAYQRPDDTVIAHPVNDTSAAVVWSPGANHVYGPKLIGDDLVAGVDASEIELERASITSLPLVTAPAPPPPQPPSSAPIVAAWPRKLWLAPYFSFSERYGDSPDFATYGNAATLVVDTGDASALPKTLARVFALGLPLIVDANVDPAVVQPYIGNVVAWLASGGAMADLGVNVARARTLPEKPIIAYCDGTDNWTAATPAWMTRGVWPAVQAYRRAGETVVAFQIRISSTLSRVTTYGSYVVLTPRFDDVNGTQPVSFTLADMPVYDRAIRQFPICGVMPFSDRRGYGIAADASLKAWAQAFETANVARPNRFDYWTPTLSDTASVLKNKLGQSVEMVVLSAAEKQFILSKL